MDGLRRTPVVALLFTVLMSAYGCQGTEFYFQSFTFPSNIPAHESGWTYMCQFTVSTSAKGGMLRKSEKTVQVAIVNADEIEVFIYERSFENVAGLRAEAKWTEVDSLDLKIVEYAADQMTVESDRDETGGEANVLQTIRIRLDQESKKFILSPE